MQQQKDNTPLHKRHVESFEALADKRHLIVKITYGEEIACCREEQGHVKLVKEMVQHVRAFGMADDHEDDGDSLGNADSRVAHNCFYSFYGFYSFYRKGLSR